MANTLALAGTHRISPKTAIVGVAPFSVVSTDTYATASGGISVDISTILTALSIQFSDVLCLLSIGTTLTGHVPTAIKTTTAGTFTIRLWNGTSQIADGAITQTMQFLLVYSPGSAS
jgi:hypothetical protein